MLKFSLLQSIYNRYKLKMPGTRFELARCTNTIRFPNERGNQFRHPGTSKIHNGSIKVDCFRLTLINLVVSIPHGFYKFIRNYPNKIE